MSVKSALLAVVLLAVPYLAFLGSHQLWQPYEPDLVETAREMRVAGDYVVPRLDGQIYAEKPPLYYWSALLAAEARGTLDETAARLPCALAALALVVVTAAFGTRHFGPRAGLLSALIIGTTPLVFLCGTAGNCDMLLALATTLAAFAFHEALFEGREAALVAAGAFTGVSMLAKSLVGPVLVVLIVAPSLVLDRAVVRRPRARYLVLAAVAFLAVVTPWYVAIGRSQGWRFLEELLYEQTFARFLGNVESKGHLYTYLGTIPGDFMPWTIFLPLAWVHARRARETDPTRWRRIRFLVSGFVAGLVFLSISACRIGKYALPLMPLLALVVGAALDDVRSRLEECLAKFPALGLAVALAVGALVASFVVAARAPLFIAPLAHVLPLLLLAAVALYVAARAAPSRVAVVLAVSLSAGAALGQQAFYPVIDELRTDRPLEDAIRTFVGPRTPYAGYRLFIRSYLIFYSERTYALLGAREELDRWLAGKNETAYVLLRDYDWAELSKDRALAPRLTIVGRNPPGIGHDYYYLVRVTTAGAGWKSE